MIQASEAEVEKLLNRRFDDVDLLIIYIDGIHFGDDYGSQTGLIFGAKNWRKFIKPRLARLFAPVREAGKLISLHSCGKVQELFDDLRLLCLNLHWQ